jgi:hypothetical protein
MLNFKQYLEEGRDAPLYHTTDESYMRYIIEKNSIKAKTEHQVGYRPGNRSGNKWKDVISLTRSIKFAHRWGERKGSGYYFIFELDQRKLSQRHKFVPYNHFGDHYYNDEKGAARRMNDVTDFNFPINQYEENIIGDIKNLNQYLTKIILSEKLYNGYFSEKNSDRQDAVIKYGKEVVYHKLLWYNGKFINAHYYK